MGMELKDLKKKYGSFMDKYKLPKFEALNADFEIDKIDKESHHFLRVIRKVMMEKIVNSMGFLEMLINPMNTHRMYLHYMKTMPDKDKKDINDLYGRLADLSLLSLDLEIDSDNKNEVELINRVFREWQGLKPGFRRILESLKKPSGELKKDKGYFG